MRYDMQSVRKCKPSCQGRIITEGRYCPCLEAKLPKPSRQSVQLVFLRGGVENMSPVTVPVEYHNVHTVTPSLEEEISALKVKLKRHGLSPYEVDLVILRYGEDITFREIVDRSGWTSTGSASYALQQILKKLRKAGFK